MKKASIFYYIFTFIMIIVFIILILSAYSNLSGTAVNAEGTSAAKPTIVLDAGHGGEDGGAVANNITEKDINLQITEILSDMFISNGYEVILTRNGDNSIETSGDTLRDRKVSDMKNRLKIYNSSSDNIVISIHQNKFTESKYYGTQVFYSPNNQKSSLLAESVRKSVTGLLQPENERQCKSAGNEIYLLYNATVPAVIVECGFISNAEEAQKLSDEAYQKQIAWTVFLGTVNYINDN